MSRWIISHSTATILSPFLSAFIICLIVAITTNQFVGMFDGVAILLFIEYIYLFISLPILFAASFIKFKTVRQKYITQLAILFIVGFLLELVLLTNGMNYFVVFLYVVIIALTYLFVQLVVEVFISSKLNIIDEDHA